MIDLFGLQGAFLFGSPLLFYILRTVAFFVFLVWFSFATFLFSKRKVGKIPSNYLQNRRKCAMMEKERTVRAMPNKKRLLSQDASFYDHAMRRMNNSSIFTEKTADFDIDVFWCRYIRHSLAQDNEARKRMHSHSFFELHCILNGSYCYTEEENKQVSLSAGDFLLIPPHVRHSTENTVQNSEVFALTFEPIESASPALRRVVAALHSASCCYGRMTRETVTVIELLMREIHHGQLSYAQNVKALLNMLLIELIRVIVPSELWQEDTGLSAGVCDHRLAALEKYMLDNPETYFTVSELAEYVNLSTKQLNNIVQKDLGVSAKTFIDRLKSNCARKLLLETDLTLYEISCRLGFTDHNNFNRFFKRVEGISPGLFRLSGGK